MAAFVELRDGMVIETDDPESWRDAKRLTQKEGREKRKAYCRARLLELVKPGDTIYTVLRHVSSSGMTRRIDLYTMSENRPQYLSGFAAGALGDKLHDHGGIVVHGCGMDMGFNLVYNLSYVLFKDQPPTGHKDGGYALRHEWL